MRVEAASDMAPRSKELNAFEMSTDKMTYGSSRWCVHCRTPSAIMAQAWGAKHPVWSGNSRDTDVFAAWVDSSVFPASRLKVSPTAIGRTPDPSTPFFKAIRFAEQRYGENAGGNDPDTSRWQNWARAEHREDAEAELRAHTSSTRWPGR